MPIYAYKCDSCGHAKDVLQKMSDAPLSVCPACGEASFQKQLTAAGFQLKGSGWYVTDFRNGNTGGASAAGKGESQDAGQGAEGKGVEGKGAAEGAKPGKPAEGAGSAPAPVSSGAPAAAPAAPAAGPAPGSPSPSSSS